MNLDPKRVIATPVGRNYKARCPWHEERTASLNIKGDAFRCFGCGLKGAATRDDDGRFTLTPGPSEA